VNYLIVSIIRNLIVISNVRPDRLLPQEAIERANEYKYVLKINLTTCLFIKSHLPVANKLLILPNAITRKLFSSIRPDHEAFQQLQTKINKFTSYQKLSSTETGEMTENKKTPYDILSENSINEEDVSMVCFCMVYYSFCFTKFAKGI
jgi:hypothetical protein